MLAIREVTRADAPLIATMIRELADFEQELQYAAVTAEDLLRDGFRDDSLFHALLAEWDGQPAAYAAYFFTYSTLAGRPSLFVEDLYVRPQFRRKGIAKTLLQKMVFIAGKRNCWGMRWEVLRWNTAAINLYRSLGATIQSEAVPVFLFGDRFEESAHRRRPIPSAARHRRKPC
jgi:GNAT superfamily N-acetyltransferase